MTAYYNEIDPYAAQWLRNLIDAGHIAPGFVDERSIEDVLPSDLAGFTQCHFFAGIGAWSLALRRAGWPDSRPVWTGSCPCQPFSSSGKGAGFDDERHLWPSWHWLIGQRRPSRIFGEQVASDDIDPWIDLVHADLEALDYSFGCVSFPASGVGAPQPRERTFWVAGSHGDGWEEGRLLAAQRAEKTFFAQANKPGHASASGPVNGFWAGAEWVECREPSGNRWRPVEPGACPVADGVAQRVGRLRAYGNAINVQAAKAFIEATM